jgi:hypothetical protein
VNDNRLERTRGLLTGVVHDELFLLSGGETIIALFVERHAKKSAYARSVRRDQRAYTRDRFCNAIPVYRISENAIARDATESDNGCIEIDTYAGMGWILGI